MWEVEEEIKFKYPHLFQIEGDTPSWGVISFLGADLFVHKVSYSKWYEYLTLMAVWGPIRYYYLFVAPWGI